MSNTQVFPSPAQVKESLNGQQYIASDEIATTVFLTSQLGKPLLCEGPAGVGKTELAKSIAGATGRELIRLQCYEGLDETKALYETAAKAKGPALVLIKGLPDSRVFLDFKDVAAVKPNGEVLVEAPTPGTAEWSVHIKVAKEGYGDFSTRMMLRGGNSYTVLADQPKKRR